MSGRRNGDDGPSGKGSVRRARERAQTETEAGGAPDPAQLAQLNDDAPARQPPPAPAAFKSVDQASKGSVISRPAPMPQWPLPGSRSEKTSSPESQGQGSPSGRGPAPQRPARPGNVPSFLDASKVQEYTPNLASRNPPPPPPPQPRHPPNTTPPAAAPNNRPSPPSTNESATSSSDAPSTTSSVGTIPDFPLPATQAAQSPNNGATAPPAPPPPPPPPPTAPPSGRKSLGPPPTSRRGGTSFYSASSYVTPIPEELHESSPRNTKSYASSKVMPLSWGSTPAASDIINAYDYPRHDDGDDDDDGSDFAPSIHDDGDDGDGEVGLVREASLGKRAKPSLRTINKPAADNGGALGSADAPTPPKDVPDLPDNNGHHTPPKAAAEVAVPASTYSGLKNQVDAGRQHRHQRSFSSSSDSSNDDHDLEKPPITKLPHPTLKELEMEDLNRGGYPDGNRRKRETKRPPRLNIDAVREAEERGSMTSLPDLIRRATRLAGNLDRGRTASRFGILDMLNAGGGGGDARGRPPGQRNSGSLSDILASFPPPGAATPSGDLHQYDRQANPDARLPDDDHPDAQRSRGRRRCCGMPRWAFILLCVALVIIVVAAVVVPVVLLVVIPRQRDSANAQTPASGPMSTDTCAAEHPCQNGGVSTGSLGSDSCGCVCVDGFSGSDCSAGDDSSCTTLDVSGASAEYQNATLGSALPRLFEGAGDNFSIPLDASKIVSLFNTENVSCTSENAIVTFNGHNQRRGPVRRRQYHRDPVTSRGVFENVENRRPEVPTPTSTESTSTHPSSSSSPSPSAISKRTLDFARVAVLFILQQTGDFKDATTANESIQRFFRSNSDSDDEDEDGDEKEGEGQFNKPMDVSCDDQEFELDFVRFSITLANGTVVGGGGTGG